MAHATAALGRVLDPPIIATSVSLKVCPKAAQLALDLATSVRTARRVAPEAEAVTEEAPTSGLEQFELLLLSWTHLTCIFTVQISAAQHWGEAIARRVTRWDLHVEQVAAALDCCSHTSVTVTTGCRLAGASAATDFTNCEAAPFGGRAHTTAARVVTIDAPASVPHDVILNRVACLHQLLPLNLALPWVPKRFVVRHPSAKRSVSRARLSTCGRLTKKQRCLG